MEDAAGEDLTDSVRSATKEQFIGVGRDGTSKLGKPVMCSVHLTVLEL